MNTYPHNLLPLPRAVYAGEETNNVIRTQFDSGRSRQRQRFVGNLKMFSVTLRLSSSQFLVWRLFHSQEIANGADYFEMDFRIETEITRERVRIVQGSYRFNVNTADNLYDVSFTVEIEKTSTEEDGAELWALIEALGLDWEEFPSYVDEYYIAIHESLPAIFNN